MIKPNEEKDQPNSKATFEEAKALNGVGAFHQLFDLPVLDTPQIPDDSRCRLRLSLLEEELRELREAIEQRDLVAVVDAFCDLQYVLSGAIHEFGLGSRFGELFEEVQRSNMSKACKSLEEAKATQEKYLRERNVTSEIVAKQHLFLVYRQEDRKVLKSLNYSPANLEKLL
ncbi:MAG: nucleoside triphosphate pyrophosphohydrolase family protein [Saprospiraceae bacterium]|nr:nucleoside triphosphate pyrophosphohydrolase family protein [Saprospiraceae bacterium]